MEKKVANDDAAHKLQPSLKRDSRDAFSKVITRKVHKPAKTCGELLDAMEGEPPPRLDLHVLGVLAKQRGRRSHMKK